MNQGTDYGQFLEDVTHLLIKEELPNVLPKMWRSGSRECRILL